MNCSTHFSTYFGEAVENCNEGHFFLHSHTKRGDSMLRIFLFLDIL